MFIHIEYTVKRLKNKPIEILYFNPLDGNRYKIFPEIDNEDYFKQELLKSFRYYKNFNFVFHLKS